MARAKLNTILVLAALLTAMIFTQSCTRINTTDNRERAKANAACLCAQKGGLVYMSYGGVGYSVVCKDSERTYTVYADDVCIK